MPAVATSDELSEPFDVVFIATKATVLREVATAIIPLLKPESRVADTGSLPSQEPGFNPGKSALNLGGSVALEVRYRPAHLASAEDTLQMSRTVCRREFFLWR